MEKDKFVEVRFIKPNQNNKKREWRDSLKLLNEKNLFPAFLAYLADKSKLDLKDAID